MVTPRASAGLLRNRIRPTTTTRYFSATQTRKNAKDDLGGPGGQQPIPNKPGGPEAAKRNWVTIGGGALLVAAIYSYFSAPEASQDAIKSSKDAVARKASEAEAKAGLGGGLAPIKEDVAEAGRNVAAQTKEQASKTLKDMSGRNKTEQGSFRHD
ncbi:hypothetical protein QQS21_007221 [Conoideocrella luteorostrata]|uniref:Uncharacterized protein n=1 Tax=Conoideocrella luteorostrata TaxID=1105319 RepID=A0AAJ0FS85_9HYPO|nr:hypothetical protein QQS21_007221 [Conoideocrella luteorostrata]